MKKHYITPTIKSVTFAFSQSLLADSLQGGVGGDSSTQLTNTHRDSHGGWGHLWGVGDE